MAKYATYNFDEQTFVEHYLRDYSSNQDIAAIDDIYCVIDGEYNDDADKEQRLTNAGYFDMSIRELRNELHRLERKVLEQAFQDYLSLQYD